MRRVYVGILVAAASAAFLLPLYAEAQGTAPTRPPYRLNQLTPQSTHTFPCNPTVGTAALQACTLQSYFSWSGSTLGINTFVGDSGSGGAVGLVPAPVAGDAAAGKYLSAGGGYSVPGGGGGGSGTVISGIAGQLGYYNTSTASISGNANVTISSGALTIGQTGSIIGKAILSGNTSGAVTIAPQAAAGTYNFNLPTGAGTAGQPMLSGGGVAAPMTFGTLAVGGGGTGLTVGTSGGIPYFSSTSAMTSSAALTAHGVVIGGGAGIAPTSTSAGTAGQALTSGGSSADPTFGTLAVGGGGTGMASGFSGGVPYFTSTSAMSSSPTLTIHGVIVGGGAGAAPNSTTAGTAGTVLTSNGASSDPTFQASSASLTTTDGTTSVTPTSSQTFGTCLLVGGSAGAATINLTQSVNSQTAGDYTIVTTDGCKTIEGGVHTYTYPLGSLGVGFGTRVHNVGTSGNMTFASTGGNFTGLGVADATGFTLAPGESADIATIAGPKALVQKFTPTSGGGGGSGSLIKIGSTQTASTSANLTLSGMTATYNTYLIDCNGLVPSAGSTTLQMELAEGSTWETSSYHWVVIDRDSSGNATPLSSSSGVAINLSFTSNIGTTSVTGQNVSSRVFINNPSSTTRIKKVSSDTYYSVGTTTPSWDAGFGEYEGDLNAITQARVSFTSGTITVGQCTLYGVTP